MENSAEAVQQSSNVVSSVVASTVASVGFTTGSLDAVSDELIVSGWAWNQDRPNLPVEISILVDGVAQVTLRPQDFRADLLNAKIGHGCYSFT